VKGETGNIHSKKEEIMLWIDRTTTNLRYAVPLADAVSRSLKMKLIMHIRN
jgi:hypothetical protein